MRYPAAETAERHERILEAAGRLFRKRGLTGVSVSQIMKETGLTHGPFYNHFASKDDLIADSIEAITADALRDLKAFSADAEGRAAYIARYLSDTHCDDPSSGCPLAALGGEGARQPKTRSALGRHLAASLNVLASHFPWPERSKGRSETIHTLATMVGAIVLARSTDDPALRREILQEIRRRHG